MIPDFEFERGAAARGFRTIAGVDEVGRGPLAGPVTAAAVVFTEGQIPEGLNDSKKLTARARERLYEEIMSVAVVCVAHATVEEIEEHNILRASHLAMTRALAGLDCAADYALIDGNMLPRDLSLPAQPVVKGDARCLSISAASIVAKTVRDRLMVDLAQQHPGYGWDSNAGYGTKAHQDGLAKHGVTQHHRRSFAPIRKMLCS